MSTSEQNWALNAYKDKAERLKQYQQQASEATRRSQTIVASLRPKPRYNAGKSRTRIKGGSGQRTGGSREIDQTWRPCARWYNRWMLSVGRFGSWTTVGQMKIRLLPGAVTNVLGKHAHIGRYFIKCSRDISLEMD